jgi:type III pantothenate kinase
MEMRSGKVPKIGKSTEEAMRFGAIVGYRGMVREIAAEIKRNFKCDFKLVATGGFARRGLKSSGMNFTVNPNLTLLGTGLIVARSEKK